MTRTPLYIEGQCGLGDNIFARPFVRAAAAQFDLYLATPWPELYEDLPVRFVLRLGPLRTQLKNILRQPKRRWSVVPKGARTVRIGYGGGELARSSIVRALERQYRALGVTADPFVFDLPDMGDPMITSDRPIAVVRPATVRGEWRNQARNPRPEYLAEIARTLAATHHVVSVADLEAGREWLVGPAPPAHVTLHRGELAARELLALMRHADVVVGGVGWIVPATIALGTKCFVVLGGHGGHNAPERITDPRMNLSHIGFAMPERFCRCTAMLHDCDKTIADLARQFSVWASRVRLCCGDSRTVDCPGSPSSASASIRSNAERSLTTRLISIASRARPTAISVAPSCAPAASSSGDISAAP